MKKLGITIHLWYLDVELFVIKRIEDKIEDDNE